MKRLALVLSLICLIAGGSKAQDVFNHIALGVEVGTAGAGVQIAAPLGSMFQARFGYSMIPPVSLKKTFSVPEHPGSAVTGRGEDVSIDAKATPNFSGLNLLFDFFPVEDNGFHITAGLSYGPKDVIRVTNITPLPQDYNTVGLDVDGYTVRAINNKFEGYLGVNSFRPYVGVGVGRAVNPDRRVNVTADLGVLYWGKPGLYAPGEPLVGDMVDVRVTSASLNGRDEGLLSKAEKFVVYPMLNLHVFVNLF